jgi:hypothetical protein
MQNLETMGEFDHGQGRQPTHEVRYPVPHDARFARRIMRRSPQGMHVRDDDRRRFEPLGQGRPYRSQRATDHAQPCRVDDHHWQA